MFFVSWLFAALASWCIRIASRLRKISINNRSFSIAYTIILVENTHWLTPHPNQRCKIRGKRRGPVKKWPPTVHVRSATIFSTGPCLSSGIRLNLHAATIAERSWFAPLSFLVARRFKTLRASENKRVKGGNRKERESAWNNRCCL